MTLCLLYSAAADDAARLLAETASYTSGQRGEHTHCKQPVIMQGIRLACQLKEPLNLLF